MDPNQANSLEEQLVELRSRVLRLEEALHRIDATPKEQIAGPAISAASAPPVATQGAAVPHPRTSPIPRFVPGPIKPPALGRSLESRIGSQWFNRIGILAVLIGMSWFLKFAIDNHWIGPLGRVLIGLVSGVAIILWSEHFQRTGYKGFAYSLKAVGSGILYLSIWAAFSLFHLIPSSAAFAFMILVTAFNGFMSWLQDAELLALYSIAGGLSTPLLLSTGENHEVALFSYLLLLNVAVLVLVMLRPWSRLLFAAFAGTAVFFAGWWLEYYSNPQFTRTAFFLICYFLIFALAPRLVMVQSHQADSPSRWDTLAQVVMPLANAALAFLALYAMISQSSADWAAPWLAVAFAAFYLLLLRLPALGLLRKSTALLSDLHLTAAVVFLTIAIPLKAHGRWLTIGWLVQGAALLWIARRTHSVLLRVLALLCLALGLVVLVAVNPPAATVPIFNQRFGTYCLAIAVFAFVAWLAHNIPATEVEPPQPLPWQHIMAVALLVLNALVLLAFGWEIHSYWWYTRWNGNWGLMHDYRMYAQFTYSAFFMLDGAILLGIGFWRRSAFLRWQALLLLAVSIGKVFLVDVSALSQGYRILSFLGLGALLLAVSFVYQRDWLHLRHPDHEPADAEPNPEQGSQQP